MGKNLLKVPVEPVCTLCYNVLVDKNSTEVQTERRTVMENKQEILNYLCKAIQATRAGDNVTMLEYDVEQEMVYVYFDRHIGRKINVACDSGIAMIRDVMRHIDI